MLLENPKITQNKRVTEVELKKLVEIMNKFSNEKSAENEFVLIEKITQAHFLTPIIMQGEIENGVLKAVSTISFKMINNKFPDFGLFTSIISKSLPCSIIQLIINSLKIIYCNSIHIYKLQSQLINVGAFLSLSERIGFKTSKLILSSVSAYVIVLAKAELK
jgi:hypothetical protein